MSENEVSKKGGISVETKNIFPVIKKWLYSDKDIFVRELVSNACDAITKHKRPARELESIINNISINIEVTSNIFTPILFFKNNS